MKHFEQFLVAGVMKACGLPEGVEDRGHHVDLDQDGRKVGSTPDATALEVQEGVEEPGASVHAEHHLTSQERGAGEYEQQTQHPEDGDVLQVILVSSGEDGPGVALVVSVWW